MTTTTAPNRASESQLPRVFRRCYAPGPDGFVCTHGLDHRGPHIGNDFPRMSKSLQSWPNTQPVSKPKRRHLG